VTTIALIGSRGFVGSALKLALESRGYSVTPVTRDNYADRRQHAYDIIVNAAMPAARYWARTHPADDFRETVAKTADLLYSWRFGKFVQVSSVSARCQLDTVYGRHKAAAERLCETRGNLIVRLGPMYGPTLSKGVLIDMLRSQPVYVDGRSRYAFAPVSFAASWIADRLSNEGLFEVGARNAVALADVAAHLGVNVRFDGALDHQEVVDPQPDYPDAADVLKFMDDMKSTALSQA
jgi:nucleoside-diphosphate-sugar epimerase